MYWCRTLGELALYADRSGGDPLTRSGKILAALAYVGLQPRRCASRDRVVELFWPGTAASQGHHNLRQALYRLRAAVPDDPPLWLDDGTLCCSEDVTFDALEGERALMAGDYAEAIELLRGTFLDDFASADSQELREWVASQQARFAECFARAAEALIEQLLASGTADRALAVAQELRAQNPLDERRVRPLIDVLDRTGQTRRALAEYEAYRTLLASAVGDEPLEDLRAYVAELEASLELGSGGETDALPFVGRSAAWSTLLNEWKRAESGECSIVLIEGDGGLGKTRLIEEFAARAVARGGIWLSGKCYEMEQTLPYAVISHAIRPANGQALQVVAGDGDGGLAFRQQVVETIEEMAADDPVLLTCDDIHWADPDSLQLLHFMTKDLASAPLLVLCTYRPAELSRAARRFTVSLASGGEIKLITLTPLTVEDVERILTSLGRFAEPDGARQIATHLHRLTEGQPLFIAELLESLEERGILRLEDGVWRAKPSLDAETLPNDLRKILTDRVDALPPDLRHMLEVISTLADTADAQIVAPVLQVSEAQAELMLGELAGSRLLRRRPFGSYAVAHDELRGLVYAAIPDDRRREIHRAVGEVLEERGVAAMAGGAARLAHHFEQAGDAERARDHALAAASEADAVGATEARESFLQLANAFDPDGLEGVHSEPKPQRNRMTRWLGYGIAAVLAAVLTLALIEQGERSPAGAGAFSRPGGAPWHQGTLYLTQNPGITDLTQERFFRVDWANEPGEDAALTDVGERPSELPPRLTTITMPIAGESHTKIFRIAGADTVQLTYGSTDDGRPLWSPDRSMIAVQRGWRVEDQYRFNLMMIDSAGATLWPITTGPQQDFLTDWSPDGTRIAFSRNEGSQRTLWITDIDGVRATNLSDRFGLPTDRDWVGSFAPDGRGLAVVSNRDSTIYVIDFESELLTRIPVGCAALRQATWSPDGGWLAALCRTASAETLVMVSADGASGPHPVLELPPGNWLRIHWMGAGPSYVTEVAIETEASRLESGQGRTLTASIVDAAGSVTGGPVRWMSLDHDVGAIDERGFFKALRSGTPRIVASAGGFRADTMAIEVVASTVDTLLYEPWTAGIDTSRWRFIGSPLPEVVPGAGPDDASALLSNGDFNWPSGVLSKVDFDLAAGLTIELPVRFRFTGGHWQELEAGLMKRDLAITGDNERDPRGTIAWWNFLGKSPTEPVSFYSCGERGASNIGLRTWSVEEANAGWHRLALQIRPDSVGECFMDGELLGTFRISESSYAPQAALYLAGRSAETRILHGPVTVTRGLRY